MRLGLASDHRGFTLKEQIKETLKDKYNEIEIIDYGTDNTESTDYPDYAFKLGEAVANNKVDFGVAICGTGIGISIACNKVKGVRCAKELIMILTLLLLEKKHQLIKQWE